jgi:hypothetical protein
MISEEQFQKLKNELSHIKELPVGWGGRKQNNFDDDKVNLFSINEYDILIESIKNFDEKTKDYYKKRWFMIKVSDCDEYLISKLPETIKNPNKYSKRFDFIIKGYEFDIKGTRIPFKYKDKLNFVFSNPKEIINFYYEQQSTGRRFGIQNRLFIITVDEDNYSDEWILRTSFEEKNKAFISYLNRLDDSRNFFNIQFGGKTLIADIIFIVKKKEGIEIKVASDLLN